MQGGVTAMVDLRQILLVNFCLAAPCNMGFTALGYTEFAIHKEKANV
jgi:hypothetical protein